jgi:hypothetical protein
VVGPAAPPGRQPIAVVVGPAWSPPGTRADDDCDAHANADQHGRFPSVLFARLTSRTLTATMKLQHVIGSAQVNGVISW